MEKKSLKQKLSDLKTIRMMKKSRGGRVKITMGVRRLLNRYIAIFLAALCSYFLLLLMLVMAEKDAPDATIHNLGQAIWYSMATFSTVGYGDMYPVTPAGRIIASVFLVLGIGLLGFFVGFMVEFFTRIRPTVILAMNVDQPWYIFTAKSQYTQIFAENLKAVRPNAMIIYAETENDGRYSDHVCVNQSIDQLLERRGSIYDAHIICMKEKEMENFLDAVGMAEMEVPIICLASFTPMHHPLNINFFSIKDCTARVFWQQFPSKNPREKILIVGFGNTGQTVLDRGLELNLFSEDQSMEYHVFGEGKEYLRNRKLLSEIVSINTVSTDRDSIVFHEDSWNADEDLVRKADRIILCSDVEWENLNVLHTIHKFFPTRGEIFIYDSNVRGVATSFGSARDMLTPAFVLHNRLSDMAMCRHEMFRFMSGLDIPMWEDTDSIQKDSCYISTDHISMKVRILLGDEAPCCPFDELEPEILRKASAVFNSADEEEKTRLRKIEHIRNTRFYTLHNFRYGETTDGEERISTLLKDFEDLSDQEQALDDIGWMLLDELASQKEARRG